MAESKPKQEPQGDGAQQGQEPKPTATESKPKQEPARLFVHNRHPEGHRITVAHGMDPIDSVASLGPGEVREFAARVAKRLAELYPDDLVIVSAEEADAITKARDAAAAEPDPLEQKPGESLDEFAARVKAEQERAKREAEVAAEAGGK